MKKIILAFFCFLMSCQMNYPPGWNTPSQYRNYSKPDNIIYSKDSLNILNEVKKLDWQGNNPFQGFENVSFQIDTIVYSDDLKKIATFVIHGYKSKVVTNGLKIKLSALCFLCEKKDNNLKKIYWFDYMVAGGYSIENIDNLSLRIREMYFNELATKNLSDCRYNFDDIRVWSEPIWNNYEWRNLE